MKAEKKQSIENRFRIIGIIAVMAFFVTLLTSLFNIELYIKLTFVFGMGLGFWFFLDNEILQSNKHYTYSLLISLVFFGYTIILKKKLFIYDEIDFVNIGALSPLTLLLIQWPTRRIYLLIFSREPEIDKYGKFADNIYTIGLFMAFAFLPFVLIEYVK